MNNKYQETFNTWDKVALAYQDKFMDLDLYNESYDSFCAVLQKTNSSILEIGCGPGNITRYLNQKNPAYKITAIDVSENMVKLAKKNIPEVDFQVMDARNISSIEVKYDGIISGFTIPYLSPIDCSKFLSDCSKLMNSDGVLYFSFVAGNEELSDYQTGGTGDRVYFYYHELDNIKKDLEQEGLYVDQEINVEYLNSKRETEIHTIVIAKRKLLPV